MSGIAGIVTVDGTSPTASQIKAIAAHLTRRGPDGTHIIVQDRVALAHTLLATTPEALVEVLPLANEMTGCTITADVRLDNRDELIADLNLPCEPRTIGDAELILHAYLKWGADCVTHLLGDFAFAIWDPRSSSLLCARDHIGMRQLTYHFDAGRRFVFATEPQAILGHPDINGLVNHERISDYLSNMEGADLTSTFFRDIYRLPPAHILKFESGRVILRRYWELAPEPLLKLPSDDDYARAFLAVFTEAVRCRLRSGGSIGAMVSGGIDSNAVASVAGHLLEHNSRGPLATFSAIGPSASDCVETRAILGAIQSAAFSPTVVSHGALGAFRADLADATAQSAEPFDGKMGLIRAVYLAARRTGINTVLDGVQSDVVLYSPFHRAFLLREGEFVQVLRDLSGTRHRLGPKFPTLRALLAAAWQAYAPGVLRAARFKWGRWKANKKFVVGASAIVPSLDLAHALKRRKLIQRRDMEHDRVDALAKIRVLTHPNLVVGRERYDRVAGEFGIEPRDPFLDLRVIRFCLSLPLEQLQRNGWRKWILRCAMAGLVPHEVAWRRNREHLGQAFTQAILEPPVPAQRAIGQVGAVRRSGRNTHLYLSNWLAYIARKLEN